MHIGEEDGGGVAGLARRTSQSKKARVLPPPSAPRAFTPFLLHHLSSTFVCRTCYHTSLIDTESLTAICLSRDI